jgi:hypothetical protein
MSEEVWGTFSVKDHCAADAFVAEVLLYDRLVIPRPPTWDPRERERWRLSGWDPDRLDTILEVLGDRATPIDWDAGLQAQWRERFDAASHVQRRVRNLAYLTTGDVLRSSIPAHVTGVQAVANYASIDDLERDVGRFRKWSPDQEVRELAGGTAVAIVASEFLVPTDPGRPHLDLLRDAVALASEPPFRRKRAAYWEWQRKFIRGDGVTDQHEILAAVTRMRDLIDDERRLVRGGRVRVGVQCAFLVASVALGLVGGPLTAVGLGGAFVSVGQFATDHFFGASDEPDQPRPAALFRDVRKRFGWDH